MPSAAAVTVQDHVMRTAPFTQRKKVSAVFQKKYAHYPTFKVPSLTMWLIRKRETTGPIWGTFENFTSEFFITLLDFVSELFLTMITIPSGTKHSGRTRSGLESLHVHFRRPLMVRILFKVSTSSPVHPPIMVGFIRLWAVTVIVYWPTRARFSDQPSWRQMALHGTPSTRDTPVKSVLFPDTTRI